MFVVKFMQGGQKLYKTSRYEYSSSSTGGGNNKIEPQRYESTQTNVNQLDNLLEDLKHERDISFDKGKRHFFFNFRPLFSKSNSIRMSATCTVK